jgi:hypothetical protein
MYVCFTLVCSVLNLINLFLLYYGGGGKLLGVFYFGIFSNKFDLFEVTCSIMGEQASGFGP